MPALRALLRLAPLMRSRLQGVSLLYLSLPLYWGYKWAVDPFYYVTVSTLRLFKQRS